MSACFCAGTSQASPSKLWGPQSLHQKRKQIRFCGCILEAAVLRLLSQNPLRT